MSHCPESLLIRERRDWLSQEDAMRLADHEATCPECRLSRQLHQAEAEPVVLTPEDLAMVERAAARVAFRPEVVRARRARPRIRRAVAAAALVVCGVATAAYLVTHDRPAPPIPAISPAPVEPPAPAAAPSGEDLAPAPAPAPLPAPSVLAHGRPSRTAQELFARANQERRRGQADHAIALYRELQRDFATSPEARLSRVSLGRLFLDGKRWPMAMVQFDRYLDGDGNGVLSAEALYGRALALDGMGRTEQARRSWAELRRRFPDSAYADVAARHLER
jgi:TolA-binding protein